MNRRQVLTLAWHGAIAALLLSLAGARPPLAAQQAGAPQASLAAAVSEVFGEEFHWTEQRPGRRHDRAVVWLYGEDAEGTDVSAVVDLQTGLLVGFSRGWMGGLMRGKEPAITAEEALKRADGFLARVGVPIREGGWRLESSRFFDHGTAGRDYEFDWSKYFHGILLLADMWVRVNGDSGLVSYYHLWDEPVVVPLVVRVPATEAVRLVVRRSGMTAPVVERVVLGVGRRYVADDPLTGRVVGPQMLGWSVWLRDAAVPVPRDRPPLGLIGVVDARTGELVRIRSLPQPPSAAGERAGSRGARAKTAKRLVPAKFNLARLRNAKPPPTVFQLVQQRRSRR